MQLLVIFGDMILLGVLDTNFNRNTMKTYYILLALILFPAFLFAQVEKPSNSSGNLQFSISKEAPPKRETKNTKSSGSLQFNFTTVKVDESPEKPSEEIISKDKTPPFITLISPVVKSGFKLTEESKMLTVTGKVEDESGVFEVLINDIEADVSSDGVFQALVPLAYGDNTISIVATDIKMNSETKSFTIERKTVEVVIVDETSGNKPVNVDKMIVWYEPSSEKSSTDQEIYKIKACISADIKISNIVLYQNGWEVFKKDFDTDLNRTIVFGADAENRDSCTYYLNESVVLQPGENLIKIEVNTPTKLYSKETTISYNMISSNYHALIIGVQDYNDPAILDLDEPLNDAQKVYDVLTEFYTFDPDQVTFLKNPTKADIIGTLHEMRSTITKNDNLLIFYAGHGYWDKEMNNGYWLPSDANQDNPVNWLPNTDLTNYLSVIKSNHTLLITDACFSGGIFKTRNAFDNNFAIEQLYKLPSRKAITSGTLNVVPDKSVFLVYLIKRLKENVESYFTAEQLFSSLRMAVINNSPNIPQYGTIQNVGDEGGDFIFIKR